MGLPQRRDVIREDVAVAKIGECYSCGFFRRHATCDQLAIAVIQMLRELFDDLCLARRRQAQAR
jgi:hypothetical protein